MKGASAPHRIASIYYTGIEFSHGEMDLLIDVSDQIGKRIQAEMLFAEVSDPKMVQKRVEASAGAWGWMAGVGYAEPFIRARPQVGTHLTVTDHESASAAMSPQDCLKRMTQMFVIE
jgi:hypothetical protein